MTTDTSEIAFDPYVIPVRKDGTRLLSGLTINESLVINSVYGRLSSQDGYSRLYAFVGKMTDDQKKIILACGKKPKSWSAILRHAKVKPRPRVGKAGIYDIPIFPLDIETKLFSCDGGYIFLTQVGISLKRFLLDQKKT